MVDTAGQGYVGVEGLIDFCMLSILSAGAPVEKKSVAMLAANFAEVRAREPRSDERRSCVCGISTHIAVVNSVAASNDLNNSLFAPRRTSRRLQGPGAAGAVAGGGAGTTCLLASL